MRPAANYRAMLCALVLQTVIAISSTQAEVATLTGGDTGEGLVAYYPLNESIGSTTAVNAAGGGHDGIYRHGISRGGVTLEVPGPPASEFPAFSSTNTAARFNAAPAATAPGQEFIPPVIDYLEIDDIANLNSTSYSYEVWFAYYSTDVLQYIGGRGAGGEFEAVGLSNVSVR